MFHDKQQKSIKRKDPNIKLTLTQSQSLRNDLRVTLQNPNTLSSGVWKRMRSLEVIH
jgi:hypothetical protein